MVTAVRTSAVSAPNEQECQWGRLYRIARDIFACTVYVHIPRVEDTQHTAPFHSSIRVQINSIQFFLQLCARHSFSKLYVWLRLILTSSPRNITRDVILRALPTQENSYLAHRTTPNGKKKKSTNIVGNLSTLQLTGLPFVTCNWILFEKLRVALLSSRLCDFLRTLTSFTTDVNSSPPLHTQFSEIILYIFHSSQSGLTHLPSTFQKIFLATFVLIHYNDMPQPLQSSPFNILYQIGGFCVVPSVLGKFWFSKPLAQLPVYVPTSKVSPPPYSK